MAEFDRSSEYYNGYAGFGILVGINFRIRKLENVYEILQEG